MIKLFRIIAYLEGTSFLVLLLIAMPLKYVWDMPLAVRIAGTIHGGLFVAYCIFGLMLWRALKCDLKTAAFVFVSAFLPAGPFVIDRRILNEAEGIE